MLYKLKLFIQTWSFTYLQSRKAKFGQAEKKLAFYAFSLQINVKVACKTRSSLDIICCRQKFCNVTANKNNISKFTTKFHLVSLIIPNTINPFDNLCYVKILSDSHCI